MDPEELFLKLLEWPRPRVAIDARLSAAPDVPLHVQALTHIELSRILREKDDRRRVATIAGAITLADGTRAFADVHEAAQLSREDLVDLAAATQDALRVCSPWFGFIDDMAWRDALAAGGRRIWPIVDNLAGCGSYAIGPGGYVFNREPERYWGCARKDLLDGHLLVYSVARHLVED